MPQIQLKHGTCLVDAQDEHILVPPPKWYSKPSSNTLYYAVRHATAAEKLSGLPSTIFLHNTIMGNPPFGFTWDHIDKNGLNNERSNLRLATHSQQRANHKLHSNNTSGYRGVTWLSTRNCWRAKISVRGQFQLIGYFNTAEQAAHAYDSAALLQHGEFANLNFTVENDLHLAELGTIL